mmetsp:Transcript_20323/g.36299  ORF Transcript_20323/g.36299 Transcript_20323/m.36299 type:complete len:80 (-) Transcript_20323:1618-1857(-)
MGTMELTLDVRLTKVGDWQRCRATVEVLCIVRDSKRGEKATAVVDRFTAWVNGAPAGPAKLRAPLLSMRVRGEPAVKTE